MAVKQNHLTIGEITASIISRDAGSGCTATLWCTKCAFGSTFSYTLQYPEHRQRHSEQRRTGIIVHAAYRATMIHIPLIVCDCDPAADSLPLQVSSYATCCVWLLRLPQVTQPTKKRIPSEQGTKQELLQTKLRCLWLSAYHQRPEITHVTTVQILRISFASL